MAIAYCLTKPFMASVIIGATSMPQLKADLSAVDLELSADVLAEIARVHRLHPMPI
jgi:aryl-alcohol dehydrogenase-like predicted oxidoreductase